MKKLIFSIFIVVVGGCCLGGQAIGQGKISFSKEKRAKIEARALQVLTEFDRQLRSGGMLTENFSDSKMNSLFKSVYPHRDTIGSQHRFEQALCPQLQQAVQDVLTMEFHTDCVSLHIFEQNGKRYCSLVPVDMLSGEGYLLYRNRVLVDIYYDSKALADLVMKPDELKELPYDWFLPIWEEVLTVYDGPSDYYRIVGQDSLEFVGRLNYWEELP